MSAALVGRVSWLTGPLLFSCPVNSESVLTEQFSHHGSGGAFFCHVVALLDKMSQEELSVFREAAKLSRESH